MPFKVKTKKTPNKGIDKLSKLRKELGKNNILKVGLPKGSNAYPDGTSVIMVGFVHEFGSDVNNIPERSFLRSTLIDKKSTYKQLFKSIAKSVVDGSKMLTAINKLGLVVQGDVQQKIVNLKNPPNTQGTVSSKGSSNPLIDTGHLRQSITFEVND